MIEVKLSQLIKELNERKPGLVLLQLPEGLKQQATELLEELKQKTSAEFVALMDPCFGSCDLAEEKAKAIKADLLVHFGHTEMNESIFPTIFVPVKFEVKASEFIDRLKTELNKWNYKKICLVASTQYTDSLKEFKELLEGNGFKVFLKKGSQRVKESGQVLGCNYSAAKTEKADAIVFAGDGLFHSLGLAFSSEKPVIQVNPSTKEVKELKGEKELFLKKRFASIASAQKAKSWGIILSTKKGQMQKEKAFRIKKDLEKAGKKAFLFAADYVNPDHFLGVNVEAFICTACPRIAIDDSAIWKKPIINPSELEIALRKRKLEEYKFDEIQ